jgi:non-canonical purine NTP pyrophosphatase (RdgB/HAM1 family)
MAEREIVVATGNPSKLKEIRAVLGALEITIRSLADFPPIEEPIEDGTTFAANARLKATYYAQQTGCWCLADDSGLVVDALEGEPGVHSARYASEDYPDDADRDSRDALNNTKLLRELGDTPNDQRTARFVCALALADQEQVLLETFGAIEGHIAHGPAGENGFGYDPLFFVPEFGKTTAELPAEQKNAVSHRGKAVEHFKILLAELLARSDG